METEIWKPIKGFEGIYEVSNQGKIKSLERNVLKSNDISIYICEKILKKSIDIYGYYLISLSFNGKIKTHLVHRLVWDHFGDRARNGHKLQIDHINNIKTDNSIENLQVINQRENISKGYQIKKTSSKYTGVTYNKRNKKWLTRIYINGINTYLGLYINEIEAHLAYQRALKEQNNKIISLYFSDLAKISKKY